MKIRNTMLIGILSLGLLGNAIADLNSGLMAYYPFDGSAKDESGNGLDGVVYGANLIEDRFGNLESSYNFNGVNDFIELPNIQPSIFSISLWFNTTGTNGVTLITSDPDGYSCNHGYSLWIHAFSTDPTSSCGDGNYAQANDSLSDGVWHHMVAIFSGTQMKLYVDGLLQESVVNVSTYNKTNSVVRIGTTKRTSGGPQTFYKGSIDDIRIYNRALLESEVQELHQEGADACTEYSNATVAPNLDIHLPSLNYQSLTETLNLWVDLEFYGQDDNIFLWKLKGFGEHKGSDIACDNDVVSVSPSLDIQLLSIDYHLLSGTLNLWANFEYYGQGTQGELLWKLIDYGEN